FFANTTCGVVDCDDSDPHTYPGALEINDGKDNQCPGDTGYGIVDEIDGISGFLTPGDKATFSWPAQSGATSYDVAPSSDPLLASDCAAFTSITTSIADPDVPPPQVVRFYIVRPAAPHLGSWGRRSAGEERTASCP